MRQLASRVHVVHVVHSTHLLLDGSGNRLFEGLSISANVGGNYLNFRRCDVRKLGDWQAGDRHDTDNHGDDRNHHGHNRAIDEEL